MNYGDESRLPVLGFALPRAQGLMVQAGSEAHVLRGPEFAALPSNSSQV